MSNRKKVKIDKNFVIALKEHYETEVNRSVHFKKNKNWIVGFTDYIREFIDDKLELLDKELYQDVYHLNGGKYPSSKTVSRAFIHEYKASHKLINICGLIMYKDSWPSQMSNFTFSDDIISIEKSHRTTQASNIEAGEDLKIKVINASASLSEIKAGRHIDINIESS